MRRSTKYKSVVVQSRTTPRSAPQSRSKSTYGSKLVRKLETYTQFLNNDIDASYSANEVYESRVKNTTESETNTVSVETQQNNANHEIASLKAKQNVDSFEVQIWIPSTSLATDVGTDSVATAVSNGWLRVTGTGCKAARVQVTTIEDWRPSTAPATVQRLSLIPRPKLHKYRANKPVTRKRCQKQTKTKLESTVNAPEVREEVISSSGVKRQSSGVRSQRTIAVTRAEERKRRAEAKLRAENEFRRLLEMTTEQNKSITIRFPPYLIPSSVPGTSIRLNEKLRLTLDRLPRTVCFKGMPAEKALQGLEPVLGRKLFVHYSGMASTPVRVAFLKAGFRVSKSPTIWNVLWGPSPVTSSFQSMSRFHKVNHFPGSNELGRKDKLYRNYRRLKSLRGSAVFDFIPKCFVLPEQRNELRQELARSKRRRYIVKPAAASCGRGIHITSNPSIFSCAKECVVQQYVQNPMTIDGFKFDLRVYVGVTSYDPLRVYVYQDGFVRFATESYTTGKNEMDNRYVHITNTSVNKRKANYVKNQDAERPGVGSKWSIQAFRAYLTKHRIANWNEIWTQIHEIIAKTFICVESPMLTHLKEHNLPTPNSCFEILGFDILIDSNSRAWLLEVNTFPDLSGSSPLDQKMKLELVEDMLNMIGIVAAGSRKRKAPSKQSCVAKCSVDFEYVKAEVKRRGNWEPVIPNLQDPFKYNGLFETQRESNETLWTVLSKQ